MSESATPKCPACGRALINRLVDYCLYCSESIPEELQLTDQEKAAIEEQQKEQIAAARQRRVAQEREQEAERKQRSAGGDFGSSPTDFLL